MPSLTRIRCFTACLVVIGITLGTGAVSAATGPLDAIGLSQPWKIDQPRPDATVAAADFFIAVQVRSGYSVDVSSVSLLLDGEDISDKARVTASSVTAVLGRMLSAGTHSLEITARGTNGHFWQPLIWSFSVEGSDSNSKVAEQARPSNTRPPNRSLGLVGYTEATTRNATLSGNRFLKQQPLSMQTLSADLQGQYGEFRFPIKLHLTSNESALFQPRNRFLLGVESRFGKLHFGDTTPGLNEMMAMGSRSRGALVGMNLGFLHVELSRGSLQRGIDGLTDASSAINSLSALQGMYTRDLTTVRLGFGNPESVFFSFSGLRATDDSLSAQSELRPLQNLVVGTDFSLKTLKDRVHVELGSAISVTTEDISRGATSKSEIDSLFQTNLPVDPAAFSSLIILNPTTYPLRLDELTSLSWYTKGTFRLPNNTLRIESRSVGSAYYSAANPYLQPNRSSIYIADRFRFFQQKLTGSTSYYSYISSPDAIDDSNRLSSKTVATSLAVRTDPDLPRVSAGFRLNTRNRQGTFGDENKSSVTTFSGGLSHAFESLGIRHMASISVARTERKDHSVPQFSNRSNSITAVLTEQFQSPLFATAQFTHLSLAYDSLFSSQKWTTAALLIGYRFDFGLRASGRYSTTLTNASDLAPSSQRHSFSVQATYDVSERMQFEMQLGVDRFDQPDLTDFSYNEQFVAIRHRYRF